ncbi:MAG TPA: HAD-IA family hydrolase [Nitrospiria bacterium]|nr:HAD-IA family hydrolase [Nitrospiria bacterium]
MSRINCAWAELVLFDLDGTLADTKSDLATAVNLTFADLGLPPLPETVIAGYVGDGIRKLIAKTLGESGSPRYAEALYLFRTHYLTHLLDTTRFYPGMTTLLRRLSSRKRVVVTNKPMEYTSKILEGLDGGFYFELVIGSDPSTPLKPDPHMLKRALDHFDIPPARAIMVGDGVNDIVAARALGVRSCAVGYGLAPSVLLQSAAPDYFCATVDELTVCLCGG